MPFMGQDHRSPGHKWTRVGSNKWEANEQDGGVYIENLPRSHAKKIIEAFLRQVQQKKYRSLYNNLTSAPVSKCSVREDMTWLQVDVKSSKECHGYTTLGEVIRRLDLAGAAKKGYRFPYILKVTELLVQNKLYYLSGTAQAHLFQLIDALVHQVLETHYGIRQMKQILNKLMTFLQQKSKKFLFSSKNTFFKSVESVRSWKNKINQISIPQRLDNNANFSNLPIEITRQIVSNLDDYQDVVNLSRTNRTFNYISNEKIIWERLCEKNFTQSEIVSAKKAMIRRAQRKKEGKIEMKSIDINNNSYVDYTSTCHWKKIHAYLNKTYNKREGAYTETLLYCHNCNVIFWKDTGHPCIVENQQDKKSNLEKISPNQLLSFFKF